MGKFPLVIGFDADDTLWHNEDIFERTHERYRRCLANYHDAATVDRTLIATERRNLARYGYGVKGFTLSAIETAIQLTDGRISGEEIGVLLELGREMLDHPVELLPEVPEVLLELGREYRLMLVTKGDLRDQERKLAKSNLAGHFQHVEIVSEKDTETYGRLLRRHGISAEDFLMVGNSLKSDIHPVVSIGGFGIHIPYRITWELERVSEDCGAPDRVLKLDSFRQLPEAVRRISLRIDQTGTRSV